MPHFTSIIIIMIAACNSIGISFGKSHFSPTLYVVRYLLTLILGRHIFAPVHDDASFFFCSHRIKRVLSQHKLTNAFDENAQKTSAHTLVMSWAYKYLTSECKRARPEMLKIRIYSVCTPSATHQVLPSLRQQLPTRPPISFRFFYCAFFFFLYIFLFLSRSRIVAGRRIVKIVWKDVLYAPVNVRVVATVNYKFSNCAHKVAGTIW